ncbi:MAG: Alkyl hydroperoxide reductase subunit C-like protein [Myxococcales bacterium]|nr:Alkyl hydroperoxide reductase subunit C-like protein [Myxococcales bacterium]
MSIAGPGQRDPEFSLRKDLDHALGRDDLLGRPSSEPNDESARRCRGSSPVQGTSERALFVPRPDGVIAWRYVSPVNAPVDVNPGADGIFDALERFHQEAA